MFLSDDNITSFFFLLLLRLCKNQNFFFFLHLHTSNVTTHLWRLMFWSCQQNLLPSRYIYIILLALNVCNKSTSTMFHTLSNCYHYSMLSLFGFALYRHTACIHTYIYVYKLRLRHTTEEKDQYHFITHTTKC